jgi:hypothetical protein
MANFRNKNADSNTKLGEIRVRHSLAIEHEMLGGGKWQSGSSNSAVVSSAREQSIGSDRSEAPIIR